MNYEMAQSASSDITRQRRGREDRGSLNFSRSGNFSYRKLLVQKYKIWGWKSDIGGICWGDNITIL